MRIHHVFAVWIAVCINCSADEAVFLKKAVETIPPKYMADIPYDQRSLFLENLSRDTGDQRLDYSKGYVHYYSDCDDGISASSRLLIKLLERPDKSPLVFIHMPKPLAGGSPPAKNQTFILEKTPGDWKDVTAQYLNGEIDLKWSFLPLRDADLIESGPYERYERNDGRGYGFYAERSLVNFIWNGTEFHTKKSISPQFHRDD